MARLTRLSRSVEGKVVLVTGAASGIGRATAQLFADEGARVAAADVQAEALAAVAKEIGEAGGEARAFHLDVTEGGRVREVVAEIVGHFGGLDVLVNNAGISRPAPIDSADYEASWEQVLAVNLAAQARLVRACLEPLERSGAGRIVNVASTEALGGQAFISAYTASKHGVVGLTRSLAVELGARGITVNCVCPGAIRTPMTAPLPEEAKQKFARRRIPLGRYGEPEEIAHAILSLALPAATYVNGAVLVVDGGLTIKN